MSRNLPPIDDDIYEFLQNEAVPLEDDVNSVLRRLLGLTSQSGATHVADNGSRAAAEPLHRRKRTTRNVKVKRARAPKGSILPEQAYELPILRALEAVGGRGPSSEVINHVGKLLDGQLTDADRQKLASGDIRWRNRAQFVRLGLIKAGDMKTDSPRGVWEISERGQRRLTEVG
jgi:hypothetical protein